MGVIQRQGLKHTIVSYFGVVIGLFSTILIYPRVPELYGLFKVIIDATMLTVSFFSLGLSTHAVKFFPKFKDLKTGHHGFLGFLLIGSSIGFIFFLVCLPLIRYLFLDILLKESASVDLLTEYFYYLVPMVFLFTFNAIFYKYVSNFNRVVIPNVFELFIKITVPVLALLFLGNFINTQFFVIGVILNYVLVLIGFLIYTKSLGQLFFQLNLNFIKAPLRKEIKQFSLFGLLNALGGQLAFKIDTLMVAAMIDITSTGIYAIALVITEVISKPAKGIIAISSPIISASWESNDLEHIKMIYQKSSTVLLIIGWFVFLGIWGSIYDLIEVMPNSEMIKTGVNVILFLGLAKLVDLATSLNTDIIGFSKKYQFNFYALLVLAVLNIIFNLYFIPIYGLVGTAIATFCSLTLFNLVKLIFIWINFKMQPFTVATVKILLLAGLCWAMIYYVPFNFHPIVNILLRSTLLTIVYGGLTLYFAISPDVNGMVRSGLNKLSGFFRK